MTAYLNARSSLRIVALFTLLLASVGCGHSEVTDSAPARAATFAPYLGQTVPGSTPKHFAPGIVNTEEIEINGVFTSDGRSFFFARQVEGVFTIFRSDFGDAGWSEPNPMDVYADGARVLAVDMSITADGKRLYFLGRHARDENDSEPPGLDIWVSRFDGNVWRHAELVPPPVSTAEFAESYPVVVQDGSLYFSSQRPGGLGGSDIYRAQALEGGGFDEPVNVGPPVNSEFHEGDTFVSPDESYLILSSRRPGGLGQNDLYVSFRLPDGGWSEPVNLGPEINSEQTDFCPMASPDGKYFFFSRRTGASWDEATEGEIFWVDISVIDRLRP